MLKMDPQIFSNNLLKTQQFCQEQISYITEDSSLIDHASVFRGFNPEINGREIYEYGIDSWGSSDNKLYKTADWTLDPHLYIDTLIVDLMAYKDSCLTSATFQPAYKGDIIIVMVDETVVDGASAVQSKYLFDNYDLPPIDTWFYFTSIPWRRLLFAWIPEAYVQEADKAIAINCVDCIGWFKDWYPKEYEQYYLSAKTKS